MSYKLGDILVQITENVSTNSDGAMVSQSTNTGGLKKNYLYLDMCTTEYQIIVNPAYLSKIHQVKTPWSSSTSKICSSWTGWALPTWCPSSPLKTASMSCMTASAAVDRSYARPLKGRWYSQDKLSFRRPRWRMRECWYSLTVQTVRKRYAGYTHREGEHATEARKPGLSTIFPYFIQEYSVHDCAIVCAS